MAQYINVVNLGVSVVMQLFCMYQCQPAIAVFLSYEFMNFLEFMNFSHIKKKTNHSITLSHIYQQSHNFSLKEHLLSDIIRSWSPPPLPFAAAV